MTTDRHFDAAETRDPEAREAALMAALSDQIARAIAGSAAWRAALGGIDPAEITGRAALARLPVTRKAELAERQATTPPFGGLTVTAPSALARVFASPGGIFEPEARRGDYWKTARCLFAAGVRPGDLVINCFSYHLTPAGSMFETGAHRLGCPVFPAGTGNSEAQAHAIAQLRPAAFVGTPDYLKVLLDKGDALGLDVSSVRCGHVTGGAFLPDVQAVYRDRGIDVYQGYGTADVGMIAYETSARAGLVINEDVIVEIVRPGTGDPVPDGEVGEVVVTPINPDYPLVRFATGDLSAFLPDGASPCGRTNRRITGWMGRADQTTKVKGMFVHPSQVAAVLARHPGVGRGRLVVDRDGAADRMTLKVEATEDAGLASVLTDALTAVTNLRGTVELVPPNSLPNDGKVIDDQRVYD